MTAPPRIAASLRAERLPPSTRSPLSTSVPSARATPASASGPPWSWPEDYRIGNDLTSDHPLVRKGVPFHGPNQWAGSPRPW